MDTKNTVLIRRIIAIILLACTFIFLFAPDIIRGPYGGAAFSEMRDAETEIIGTYFAAADEDSIFLILGIHGILLNICFFGLILFAVLGIILMLLNKTKAATVLHTVLSFLTAAEISAYIMIFKEEGSYITGPGAALFLLPIFSLAASIVYQRSDTTEPAWASSMSDGLPPDPKTGSGCAAAKRFCPSCGAQQGSDALFCQKCGAKL